MPKKISPARMAAFEILRRVAEDKAFSSVLLPDFEARLSPKDRGLCHQITLGVLRREMLLDRIIDTLSRGKRLDLAVRLALRIGIYQLKFLDRIPAYSVIGESVELARHARKVSATGFVNALLRSFQRGEPDLTFSDGMDRVSIEMSHPKWLIERWEKEFGRETAESIATANNVAPEPAFRTINDADVGSIDLARYLPSKYVSGCFVAERMDAELIRASEAGAIYFQDEGSQMVGAAVPAEKFGPFLDVCAAPGSKTTQICGRVAAVGGNTLCVAGDLYWKRVEFLRANCRRQNLDFVNVVEYDAETALPFAEQAFGSVLVDAPCSGTGTIRHNPEIRYFLSPDDFSALTSKQLQILGEASKLVRKGGRLIYSTCSLESDENEVVCERFLTEDRGFRKIRPDVPENFISDQGFARTFPHTGDMDGFFIAAFERLG